MKFTVEFKTDEYRNLEKVEFTVGDDLTIDELVTEVIRPMLHSIGYFEESIDNSLSDIE